MNYVLQTNSLTKKYKHFQALNGLTMNVPKGSIYGFVGKNGAGKTTLIRLICGLQEPTSGDFTLYGIRNDSKDMIRSRRRMGAVVETAAIYTDMTPEEVKQIQEGTYHGSYFSATDDNGQVTYYKPVFTNTEQKPNPKYVKQPFRGILTHLDSMLPNGQINEYDSCLVHCYAHQQAGGAPEAEPIDAYPRLKTFPLHSCLDILLLSGVGLILFRKKEIR